MKIRDRIKSLRRVKASELAPNPRNWRSHPEAQQAAMRGILAEVGYAGAVLARETPDGLQLIDGHLRAEIDLDGKIPVLVLDVTAEEADKILATFDPLTSMAEANEEALGKLLAEIETDSEGLQAMLEGLAAENNIDVFEPGAVEEVPPQIDRAAELQEKWGTKTGDLWIIPSKTVEGEHQVLCGDSTDRATVARLMGGERAKLTATSPPYPGNAMWKELWPGKSIAECHEWLGTVWGNCFEVSDEISALIVNTADTVENEWNDWHTEKTAIPWRLIQRAVWHKTGFVPCGTSNLLAMNHEWVLWFAKGEPWTNAEYVRGGDHPLSATVFAIPFDRERLHATPYPVELPARWVNIWSDKGDIVLDPFLGSGTTMVAAEQLDRLCYGLEISPAYVAVILQRMQDLGLKPKLTA